MCIREYLRHAQTAYKNHVQRSQSFRSPFPQEKPADKESRSQRTHRSYSYLPLPCPFPMPYTKIQPKSPRIHKHPHVLENPDSSPFAPSTSFSHFHGLPSVCQSLSYSSHNSYPVALTDIRIHTHTIEPESVRKLRSVIRNPFGHPPSLTPSPPTPIQPSTHTPVCMTVRATATTATTRAFKSPSLAAAAPQGLRPGEPSPSDSCPPSRTPDTKTPRRSPNGNGNGSG